MERLAQGLNLCLESKLMPSPFPNYSENINSVHSMLDANTIKQIFFFLNEHDFCCKNLLKKIDRLKKLQLIFINIKETENGLLR